jgi:hypothetical protein
MAAMIHISQVCKLENVSHSCNHQQNLEYVYYEGCFEWIQRYYQDIPYLQA